MLSLHRKDASKDRSFLPEDYVERRSERRTNLLSLTLFTVVTVGVVGAFLVTNRQWNDVKRYQEAINVRYAQAAKDIEQLKHLEDRKEALLQKAELTTALIDRVPRSILLAELINRMPQDATLLEMEVVSKRIAEPKPKDDPKAGKGKPKGTTTKGTKATRGSKGKAPPKSGASKDGASDKEGSARPVIAAPRFSTSVILIGVTGTHNSVAQYVAELQRCPLLSEVELKFSEKAVIEEQELNRFRIECRLKSDADARRISTVASQRLMRDAMESRGGTRAVTGVGAPS